MDDESHLHRSASGIDRISLDFCVQTSADRNELAHTPLRCDKSLNNCPPIEFGLNTRNRTTMPRRENLALWRFTVVCTQRSHHCQKLPALAAKPALPTICAKGCWFKRELHAPSDKCKTLVQLWLPSVLPYCRIAATRAKPTLPWPHGRCVCGHFPSAGSSAGGWSSA